MNITHQDMLKVWGYLPARFFLKFDVTATHGKFLVFREGSLECVVGVQFGGRYVYGLHKTNGGKSNVALAGGRGYHHKCAEAILMLSGEKASELRSAPSTLEERLLRQYEHEVVFGEDAVCVVPPPYHPDLLDLMVASKSVQVHATAALHVTRWEHQEVLLRDRDHAVLLGLLQNPHLWLRCVDDLATGPYSHDVRELAIRRGPSIEALGACLINEPHADLRALAIRMLPQSAVTSFRFWLRNETSPVVWRALAERNFVPLPERISMVNPEQDQDVRLAMCKRSDLSTEEAKCLLTAATPKMRAAIKANLNWPLPRSPS
jgi:hypothetical protein